MKKVGIVLIVLGLILGLVYVGRTVLENNILQGKVSIAGRKMLAVETQAGGATVTLNAKPQRPYSDDNSDGTDGNDVYTFLGGGTGTAAGYTMYKIMEGTDINKIYYCIRGGVGFGAVGDVDVSDNVRYVSIGGMHKNAANVISQYRELYGIDLGENISLKVGEETKTVKRYNAILSVLDNAYIPVNSEGNRYDEVKYKKELLTKAGILAAAQNQITKDDIEVIQQLAVWFFTNQGDNLSRMNADGTINYNVASQLKIKDTANALNGRTDILDKLYKYIIETAIEESTKYGTGAERNLPEEEIADFAEGSVKTVREKTLDPEVVDPLGRFDEPGDLRKIYMIGPFKLTKDVKYTQIRLYDADGTELIQNEDYQISDNENGSGDPVGDLEANRNYYIRVEGGRTDGTVEGKRYKISDGEQIKLTVESKKRTSSIEAYKAMENASNNQVVVQIEREEELVVKELGRVEKTGKYNLILIKEDENGEELTSTATFKVTENGRESEKVVTGHLTIAEDVEITEENVNTPDRYEIIETEAPDAYCEFDGKINITVSKKEDGNNLVANEPTYTVTDKDGHDITNAHKDKDVKVYLKDGNIYVEVVDYEKKFDLALRKFITERKTTDKEGKVVTEKITSREPQITNEDIVALQNMDSSKTLDNGTTAYKRHTKDPIEVKVGDKVTYTIRVYNEGEVAGKATKVTDYLPAGLKLVPQEDSEINERYNWVADEDNSKKIETTYFRDEDITIHPYGTNLAQEEQITKHNIVFSADLQIECEVVETTESVIKNIAAITGAENEFNISDRDSRPEELTDSERSGYNPSTARDGKGIQDDDDFEPLVLQQELFDLALRKNIVSVITPAPEGVEEEDQIKQIASRAVNPVLTPLKQGQTTANYEHRKDAVEVKAGDHVRYRYTTYNEGDIAGRVYSIKDYLPEHMNFIPTQEYISAEELNTYRSDIFGKTETELTADQKELKAKVESNNTKYVYSFDEEKRLLEIWNKRVLDLNDAGLGNMLWTLNAYDGGETLDSKYLEATFEIEKGYEPKKDTYLTNVATMTYLAEINSLNDRDSNTDGTEQFNVPSQSKLVSENEKAYIGHETRNNDKNLSSSSSYFEGQQDDDDFEKVVVRGQKEKEFDLALRKYIDKVERNGKEVDIGDKREPVIKDLSTLEKGTFKRGNKTEYTATYDHPKNPVLVKTGDIVTYKIRVYNEGEQSGYVKEITDYIPEGLALIAGYRTNKDNLWRLPEEGLKPEQTIKLVGENGFYKTEDEVKNLDIEDFEGISSLKEVELITKAAITTPKLAEKEIKAYDISKESKETGENWQEEAEGGQGQGKGIYYEEVEVVCIVIAEITEENKNPGIITNVAEISKQVGENKQEVTDRDSQPNNKKDPYTTWQQDDDDYEPLELRYFDLALRKFITGIERKDKTEEVTTRIPKVKLDAKGNIVYEHTKDPVEVISNDTVIYTIRVYNEGTIEGYAEEVADDIPEGLEYLPTHSINKEYEWVMVNEKGEEVDSQEKATRIVTKYLSNKAELEKERANKLEAYEAGEALSEKNPDYRDIKVAFKVIEPETSDRIITNYAQITKDSGDDIDSIPDKWREQDDDQDVEHIYVKPFDLSLLKWVTQTIVTVEGQETKTNTGFKPNTGKTETKGIRGNNEAEPIAKVEIDRKKLSQTEVKFVYSIRVTNEGEIEGYASEIRDYIPEGLEFYEEDNKAYGWQKGANGTVTTRALETKLLKPGESAEVEIIFRWKKDVNNLGIKTNIAEISEDYNVYGAKDIDSTPGNKVNPYEKEQEDDDDFALVILSLKTGQAATYTVFTLGMVGMLAAGIYSVKRYVLTY